MKKNNPIRIELTELFLVKPGKNWKRTFVGTLKRGKTEDGKPVFFGSVVIKEGIMCSKGDSMEEITHNLDVISNLKLYRKLLKKGGKYVEIFKTKSYLN